MILRISACAFVLSCVAATGVFANVNPDASCNDDRDQIKRETWLRPRPMTQHMAHGQWSGLTAATVRAPVQNLRGGPAYSYLDLNNPPESDSPDDVAYTPDGGRVLVVHRETDNVTILDVNTRTVTHTIAVGDFPTDIAVTPNGQFAIVPNVFGNSLSIINLTTNSLQTSVPITGQQPYRVAITPDSAFAVVGVINDAVNSSFSVVDLNTMTEALTFPSTPQGVIGFFFTPEAGISGPLFTHFALTPDGNTIVCPHRGGAQVRLYDRSTGNSVTLSTATAPAAVSVSNDGTIAVIAHDNPGAVSRINLINQTVTNTFTIGQILEHVIRITPDNSHAIAGISNNVIFVNLTSGAIATTIMTGSVGDIELTFDGQYAFVSNFNARVIRISDRTLVATIPFAACVEAATSPVALRAVALNSRFREDIHFYNVNGASSSFEGFASTGAPPEVDGPRNLAISPNGQKLLVCNNLSRNVAVVNMATQAVQAYIEVGDRPLVAKVTPNGQYAVVCASDADRVRVIDMATNSIVASIIVSGRPAALRISPDSQWAYVLNVAGADMVNFIQLNGAASALVSQVSAGQTGSAQGYAYTEISGIELNSTGSILAVCDSFNDFLRLYDTATRTQIAAVAVGDFPIRVAFNPAGTRAYVANSFSNNVSVVNINGAASSTIATIPGIQFPLVVEVDPTGSFVYVGNSDANNSRLFIINTATNTVATSLVLSDPARQSHYSVADNVLYLALNDGNLARINAAGTSSTIIDSTPLAAGPSDMVFSDATKTAVTAQPIPDGIDIIDFDPPTPCPSDINGDGVTNVSDLLAVINAWGPCAAPCPPTCAADVTQDCVVNVSDLLAVINGWGPCP